MSLSITRRISDIMQPALDSIHKDHPDRALLFTSALHQSVELLHKWIAEDGPEAQRAIAIIKASPGADTLSDAELFEKTVGALTMMGIDNAARDYAKSNPLTEKRLSDKIAQLATSMQTCAADESINSGTLVMLDKFFTGGRKK